jgi:hypothetical protein
MGLLIECVMCLDDTSHEGRQIGWSAREARDGYTAFDQPTEDLGRRCFAAHDRTLETGVVTLGVRRVEIRDETP